MASEMVMAYGDHGLEPTPVEDVVEIEVFPTGPSNCVTPAMVRHLSKRGGRIPTRLIRVVKAKAGAKHANRAKYASVSFQCTPFVRYEADSGPVYGDRTSCYLCSIEDAHDPLWTSLPARSRARLIAAVG